MITPTLFASDYSFHSSRLLHHDRGCISSIDVIIKNGRSLLNINYRKKKKNRDGVKKKVVVKSKVCRPNPINLYCLVLIVL